MAAAAALTWCTRCPFTNEWMQDAKQARARTPHRRFRCQHPALVTRNARAHKARFVVLHTNALAQVELEPVMLKIVSYRVSCGIKGSWALSVEDDEAYTSETGICLGDGN